MNNSLAGVPIPSQDEIVIRTDIRKAISEIKSYNTERRKNQKSIIVNTLIIGRHIKESIQPSVPHGTWTAWFRDHLVELGYNLYADPLRVVQWDMQLWTGWKGWIEKRAPHSETPELDLVEFMDKSGVLNDENFDFGGASRAALQVLSSEDVTDETRDKFISETIEGKVPKAGSIRHAKQVKREAKAFLVLKTDEQRQVATKLMDKHNLTNPDVIERIPEIVASHPEIIEEMLASGTVDIPGTDDPTPVESLGVNDVNALLGHVGREKALTYYANRPDNKETRLSYIDVMQINLDGGSEEAERIFALMAQNGADTIKYFKTVVNDKFIAS